MRKIVFLDAATIGKVDNMRMISKLGDLTTYEHTPPEKLVERCTGYEIVIVNKIRMTARIMEQLPDLRLVCLAATGVDNIDIRYAKEHNIEVRNVTGYSTDSVAQMTFTMLLYLINKPAYYDNYVKSGNYGRSFSFTHHAEPFWELKGKRIGIIGLGTIGRQVARIAESFGMEVVFYSTTGRNNHISYKRFELDDLLKSSDVVTIHAPLNDRTAQLITYEKIKLMRPCAILLNLGRGGIINELDLARALNDNIIAAAGIDVMEDEPIRPDNPLLRLYDRDKILITPHMAWASVESRELLVEKIARNIEVFLKNPRLTAVPQP